MSGLRARPTVSVIGALVTATLRHMRRDRSAVVFFVILPTALMVLMGNIYTAEDGAAPSVAVVVESDDAVTRAVLTTLEGSHVLDLVTVADRAALDDAVRRRRVEAGVVLAAGRPVTLVGAPQVQLPSGVRFVVNGAVSRVDRAVAVAAATGAALDAVLAQLPPQVGAPAEDPAEARTEAAIGILVLVTFMNLIGFAAMLPSHRSLGLLHRLAAVPAGRRSVLAGYATTFVTVAGVQVVMAMAAGTVLVGVDWGAPLQVGVVAAGLAVAAGGVATAAATLLPTPESGSAIGGPVGFAIGMLGGCLWPLSFVGGTLEQIGRWIPHQWAVAALRDIASGGLPTSALLAPVAGLLACGALGAAWGSRRLASSWR